MKRLIPILAGLAWLVLAGGPAAMGARSSERAKAERRFGSAGPKEKTVLKPGDLIVIEWTDSRIGPYGWEFFHDETEDLPPLLCETAGFLVTENRDYMTVAMSVADGCIMGRLTIPAKAIRRVTCVSYPAPGSKQKRRRSWRPGA